MKFHIVTIFPESFASYLGSSILKRAQDNGYLELKFYNICDFSIKNTRRIDSRPYGGFPGTIISPQPLAKTLDYIIKNIKNKFEIIYFSPRGKKIIQSKLEKFAKSQKEYILICGHYEGIDERIIELYKIKEISIGDYILTSGELAAMVFIDGVVRLIPGVISEESLKEESFSPGLNRKKEYPQYTRPEEFMGKKVPEILLSGDLKKIQKWKIENSF